MAGTHQTNTAKACCFRSALDSNAGFCGDCGEPIIRCMAFDDCGGLLDKRGRCPVCVHPELSLDAGAAMAVKVGGSLALPLVITNRSPVSRPLFVTGLWMREDDGPMRQIELPWQRLDANASAEAGVRTGVLENAGITRLDLQITVATRYLWHEECFAFTTSIAIPVEQDSQTIINQNYNITADEIGAGMTIYNPSRIEKERASGAQTHDGPIALNLRRVDAVEKQLDLRGYSKGYGVPRTVQLEWNGFGAGHAPPSGPFLAANGLIAAGRAATMSDGGLNDVRLLADARGGGLDEQRSVHVSRRHFLRLNGKSLSRGKSVAIQDGDTLSPLINDPNAVSLTFRFEVFHDEVARISVLRRSIPSGGH